MIWAVIYVILSFFIDGIMSSITSFSLVNPGYFRTIYSIISLIVIYNYFDNKKKYLWIMLVVGILFDIVYTNTFIVNIVILFVIYIVLVNLDYVIPTNIITINIKSIVCICLYHILTYIILLLANYNSYNMRLLFLIIRGSIIMTIVYSTISYLIMNKIYGDKRIK